MGKRLYAAFATLFLVGLSACSSTKTTSDQIPLDDALAADAGTDPVPADSAEAPPPVDNPATPTPEAPAPVEQASSPVQGSGEFAEYKVQSGDTLMKIAFETYGDLYQWKRVYNANKEKISNPSVIPAGTVLRVEKTVNPVVIERNGEKYLIKLGDTLGKIADDVYGTAKKWKKVWENNRQMIKDPNKIFAGFYLYYSMTPEERNAAEQLKQQRQAAPPVPVAGNQAADPAQNREPAQKK